MKKLTRLILSLERSEKRYFKRYVGLYSDKEQDYMVLYDIIEKHKANSKPSIKEKIELANIKHPLVKANYLYQLILDALIDYQKKKNSYFQLQDDIRQIIVLRDKGLDQDALSLIKKTKKKALAKEAHPIYLELLSIENTMDGLRNSSGDSRLENAKANIKEVNQIYSIIAQKSEVLLISEEIRKITDRQGFITSVQVNEFLKKYPVLNASTEELTSKNYLNVSNVKALLYFEQESYDSVAILNLMKELIGFLDLPKSNNLRKVEILLTINNALVIFAFEKDTKLIHEILAKLNKVKTVRKIFQNVKAQINLQAQLFLEIFEAKEEPITLIEKSEKELKAILKPGIPLFQIFTFDPFIQYCILNNHLKRAVPWANKLQNLITALQFEAWIIRSSIFQLILVKEAYISTPINEVLNNFQNGIEKHHQERDFLWGIYHFFNRLNNNQIEHSKEEIVDLIKILEKVEQSILMLHNVQILLHYLKTKL